MIGTITYHLKSKLSLYIEYQMNGKRHLTGHYNLLHFHLCADM